MDQLSTNSNPIFDALKKESFYAHFLNYKTRSNFSPSLWLLELEIVAWGGSNYSLLQLIGIFFSALVTRNLRTVHSKYLVTHVCCCVIEMRHKFKSWKKSWSDFWHLYFLSRYLVMMIMRDNFFLLEYSNLQDRWWLVSLKLSDFHVTFKQNWSPWIQKFTEFFWSLFGFAIIFDVDFLECNKNAMSIKLSKEDSFVH